MALARKPLGNALIWLLAGAGVVALAWPLDHRVDAALDASREPSAASIRVVVFQTRRRLGAGGGGHFPRHFVRAAGPARRGGEDFFCGAYL